MRLCLRAAARGIAQLFVDGGAVGCDVFETPEIEAADAIGAEMLWRASMQRSSSVILLLEVEVGLELIAVLALLWKRRAGPVGFEERAGDVGDAQIVFGEDGLRALDVGVGHVGDVLVPHAAQFDPLQAEVVRGDRADVIEVLRDFVVDDGDAKGAGGSGPRG